MVLALEQVRQLQLHMLRRILRGIHKESAQMQPKGVTLNRLMSDLFHRFSKLCLGYI